MDKPAITYTPRPDVGDEAEISALANVYAFVLQKHQERQRATRPGGPEDARKESNHAGTYSNCT